MLFPIVSFLIAGAISYSHKKKMAAKYPDSDNDLDISFEVSDSEAACVADWSLCGDEKSSTVAARPSAVNADSAPDTRPTPEPVAARVKYAYGLHTNVGDPYIVRLGLFF